MQEKIKERLQQLIADMHVNVEPIQSIQAIIRFNTKEGHSYTISFENGEVRLIENGEAACTITLSEQDLLKLLNNQLNATIAYMTGAVKVEGKLTLAMKMLEVLKEY